MSDTADSVTMNDSNKDEETLLSVEDLAVRFETGEETVHAVNGIDFELSSNETLGVVGESGSGKSVTALSALNLLDDTARVDGLVTFDGRDILAVDEGEMRSIRGNRISMVFQDPGSSLNPVLKTGDQVSETIRAHQPPEGEELTWREQTFLGNLSRSRDSFTRYGESWDRTVELFERVGIPLPEKRALEYPHEFSGGMKQRALIAMAIACQPDVLIADEPTTALDVTIEAQILELINELQREFGTAVLFITHDMGVVRKVCDRVAVMYAGNIVERAETSELFESPKHPYTKALLQSVPRLEAAEELDPLPGSVPDLTAQPEGCPFAPRCSSENDACHMAFPPAYPVSADDEPAVVVERDSVNQVTTPPKPRRTGDEGFEEDHTVNCVLHGDVDELTASAGGANQSDIVGENDE